MFNVVRRKLQQRQARKAACAQFRTLLAELPFQPRSSLEQPILAAASLAGHALHPKDQASETARLLDRLRGTAAQALQADVQAGAEQIQSPREARELIDELAGRLQHDWLTTEDRDHVFLGVFGAKLRDAEQRATSALTVGLTEQTLLQREWNAVLKHAKNAGGAWLVGWPGYRLDTSVRTIALELVRDGMVGTRALAALGALMAEHGLSSLQADDELWIEIITRRADANMVPPGDRGRTVAAFEGGERLVASFESVILRTTTDKLDKAIGGGLQPVGTLGSGVKVDLTSRRMIMHLDQQRIIRWTDGVTVRRDPRASRRLLLVLSDGTVWCLDTVPSTAVVEALIQAAGRLL